MKEKVMTLTATVPIRAHRRDPRAASHCTRNGRDERHASNHCGASDRGTALVSRSAVSVSPLDLYHRHRSSSRKLRFRDFGQLYPDPSAPFRKTEHLKKHLLITKRLFNFSVTQTLNVGLCLKEMIIHRLLPAAVLAASLIGFSNAAVPTTVLLIGNAAYDATTGALINPNFLHPSFSARSGFNSVESGNTLYLADGSGSTVAKYATSGGVINQNFITGLDWPIAITILDNTLFIPNFHSHTIGTYDATTGATINANFITDAWTQSLSVSGNTLFVTVLTPDPSDPGVDIEITRTYNATTGALIDANFLPTTTFAVSNNIVFTISYSDPDLVHIATIGEYNATTKSLIRTINVNNDMSRALAGLAVLGNNLFVATSADPPVSNSSIISEYDVNTGAVINSHLISGVDVSGLLAISVSLPTPTPLVLENTITGQRAIWFVKNGAVSSGTYLPTVDPQWHIACVGDFNGDGNDDLVLENTSTGQRAIWFLKNGAVSSATYLPTVDPQWPSQALVTSTVTAMLTWFWKTPRPVSVASGS
jgi:hypothetical protein